MLASPALKLTPEGATLAVLDAAVIPGDGVHPQETHQRVQLADPVLQRSASQAPLDFGLEGVYGLCRGRGPS